MLHVLPSPSLRASGTPTTRVRRVAAWMLVGYLGLGLLLAAPSLLTAWRIDEAGILLNRQLQTHNRDAMGPILALLGSPDTARSPSYWRTYGAAAMRRPSEEAFQRLKAAADRGELDRIGALWLGEVAAATGHWEEARAAYSRVDATNMLVERGDAAMKADDQETALRWYAVAAASLRAARERDAHTSSADRALAAGSVPPEPGSALAQGRRAVPLLRIGRGFLTLGRPEEAVPVLELALAEMQADPPGVREQQTIEFALAQALAQTALPRETRSTIVETATARPRGTIPGETDARIRELIDAALKRDRTGWAEFQAGRVLALTGDRDAAAQHLAAALDLDPTLADAYLTLGAIYETARLPGLARQVYERGLGHLSSDKQLLVAWAIASYQSMLTAQALPRLEEVARSDTRDPYLFAALGDAYLDLGRPNDAIAAYRKGLQRSPGAKPLLGRLGQAYDPYWRLK